MLTAGKCRVCWLCPPGFVWETTQSAVTCTNREQRECFVMLPRRRSSKRAWLRGQQTGSVRAKPLGESRGLSLGCQGYAPVECPSPASARARRRWSGGRPKPLAELYPSLQAIVHTPPGKIGFGDQPDHPISQEAAESDIVIACRRWYVSHRRRHLDG